MAKTRVYLDVDGVLNAIPADKNIEAKTGWNSFNRVNVLGYWITFAPELLRALEAISQWTHWAEGDVDDTEEDSVEIVWLTTWRERAVESLAPEIGFHAAHWRVVTDGNGAHGYVKRGFSDYGYWWKVDALASDLIERPVDYVVWLDDDQVAYHRAVNSVLRKFNTTQFLTIAPKTTIGLTSDHIDLIKNFIRRAQDDDGWDAFRDYSFSDEDE